LLPARVLFKTGGLFGKRSLARHRSVLDTDLLHRFADFGVELVGVDLASDDLLTSDLPTSGLASAFAVLRGLGVRTLDCLRLDEVAEGDYDLVTLLPKQCASDGCGLCFMLHQAEGVLR
jgi:hypothetical protein